MTENDKIKKKSSEIELRNQVLEAENIILKNRFNENELKVAKYEKKLEAFGNLQPTFVEFYTEFPNDDPAKLIDDIKLQRDRNFISYKEMISNQQTIDKEMTEKNDIIKNQQDNMYCLIDKLNIDDNQIKKDVERLQFENTQLNYSIYEYKNYKEENIHLHNMLFNIYNQLVDRLSLEKDLTLDPTLKVTERDFKPRLLDNKELKNYISLMLKLSHETTAEKLLREIIAYSNMILRLFLKFDLNKRYDPVSVFKILQKEIEKVNAEKLHAKDENIKNKKTIEELENEIYKLKAEITYLKVNMENMRKK